MTGPNGTSVVIPAGALASDTRILIEQTSAGAPAVPFGFTAGGQLFAFTPHGTTFAVPVTVTLPFDPALVPAGRTPSFYKTNAQNHWEKISNAVFGSNSVSAQITGFSTLGTFISDLVPGKPVYQWEVFELKGELLTEQRFVDDIAVAENLAEHYDFGAAFRDAPVFSFDDSLVVQSDDTATTQLAATADGRDWWVGTEAPLGITGVPTDTVGTLAAFNQYQSFIKRTATARLSFFISDVFLRTSDANGILNRLCPRAHTKGLLCDMVSARAFVDITGFTVPRAPFVSFDRFYTLGGYAELTGIAGSWNSEAGTAAFSRRKLWSIEDFAFTIENIDTHEEALITMNLAHPIFHEYVVDLSEVSVGQAFTMRFSGSVKAYNRAASAVNNIGAEFETSAGAYLRDPSAPQGVNMNFEGLEPIDTSLPVEEPPDAPVIPETCVPGPAPNPAAGTIQFDAPNYLQLESGVAPSITVTRTGGTVGDVSATIATRDGSAIAGTDYVALANSVFFEDGDDTPRVVIVEILPNAASNEPDKTVNLTLSEPGGCAALGAQTTAVLSIQDDDPPPPPPSFTVGGTVTGLVGTGLTLQDHRFEQLTPGNGAFTFRVPTPSGSPYEVTILTQPSNPVQVCALTNGSGIVGNENVTHIEVNCGPPTAPPGGLDPEFGGGTGIVSTAFGGDETDMLLQSDDGKILMIGGSSSDFVLARYHADGRLDEGFGNDGLVTTDIAGGADAAFAAALQSDGRIIVVGFARVGSNDDFAIVRYEADGDLDLTFGTQGKITTDFNGARDRAFAVAVQPDDGLVVAGEAFLLTGGASDFAVARYDANGTLDIAFGGGDGKVTADLERIDFGKNVVLESGGTILVSGTTTLGTSSVLGHTGLARFTASGVIDPSLDDDGELVIPNLSLGEALALQGDRILVAGHAPVGGEVVFAMSRLEANGATDESFGSAGLASAGFTTQDDYGRDIVLDAAGRILVSGQASNLASGDFAVARFTADGALDTSFDTDGKFSVDFFDSSDSAENVLVQPDGKVLLGGFAVNGTALRYGLARFNP